MALPKQIDSECLMEFVKIYNHENSGKEWSVASFRTALDNWMKPDCRRGKEKPSSVPQANELLPHVSNSLLSLDGKTIPVTFHISRFEPKIDIDLSNDC